MNKIIVEEKFSIGIDIRQALGQKAGVGYYVKSLVSALSKLDKENEYSLYTSEKVDWNLGKNFRQIVKRDDSLFKKILWNLWLWLEIIILGKVDVFLSPHSLTLATLSWPRRNVVLTIHDLVPYLMRRTTSKNVRFFFLQLPISLKMAKEIIVPSKVTKNDLIQYFKIPKSKITITSEAAQDWCFGDISNAEIEKIKQKYNLPEKYFLFVSTLEPRKNIPNLIRAFSQFSKRDKQSIKLVIGGKKGWLYDEIFEVVKKEKMEDKVIFTDYIPDEDMPGLYKGALAFTFVPYMEGFGLSPLEAMTCGIPVITSNTSSLPEVVGEAAIKVDPEDIVKIAEAMERIANDQNLRQNLIKRGLEQSKKFSWEKVAGIVLNILTAS